MNSGQVDQHGYIQPDQTCLAQLSRKIQTCMVGSCPLKHKAWRKLYGPSSETTFSGPRSFCYVLSSDQQSLRNHEYKGELHNHLQDGFKHFVCQVLKHWDYKPYSNKSTFCISGLLSDNVWQTTWRHKPYPDGPKFLHRISMLGCMVKN